jgi:hypothetical protein
VTFFRDEERVIRIETVVCRVATASVATALVTGVIGGAALLAGEKAETLVYAVYNGQDTVGEGFKTLKSAQRDTGEPIESYAVLAKDLKGKVRVRDQRRRDAGVGAIIGGVIGGSWGGGRCSGRSDGGRSGRLSDA